MRYLMLKVCDGIYDFIPLDGVAFHFIETDEREYRVEITYGGHERTLFEKKYFGTGQDSMYSCMRRLAAMPDDQIIPLECLFND